LNPKTKDELNELYDKTVMGLELALSSSWVTVNDYNKISMVESAIDRYHHDRFLITGYHSTPKYKMKLERKSRIKRLLKENKRLRLELSERK